MKWEIVKIQPVDAGEKVKKLLDNCQEEGLTHYPVVQNSVFRGMLRCDDLIRYPEETPISDLLHMVENFHVSEQKDWTSLFSMFITNETNVIPFLNENGGYEGLIFLEDILEDLSEIKAFTIQGTVIRVEKNKEDFSIAQIAQIIQATGGNLLGVLIIDETPEGVIADVKVDRGDINEILQSLRRYDYKIISEHKEDLHLQELKEHAAFLNKYLEMGE